MTRYIRFGSAAWAAGTAATPVTIKSYPVRNCTFTPFQVTMIEGRPWVGQAQMGMPTTGDWFSQLSFDMDILGQAATGRPYYGGRWLEAAAFGVSGTTAYTYTQGDIHTDGDTPDGVAEELSAIINIDGYAYTCPGLLADGSLHFAAGAVPYMHIDARGYFGAGQATAGQGGEAAQTAYETLITPIASYAMSGTINSVSGLVIQEFDYNFGNTVVPQMDVNGLKGQSAPKIVSRDPTWRIRFKLDATATIDPVALFLARTSLPMSFTHNDGGAAFDELLVTWNGIINSVPQIVDVNGIACWEITGTQDGSTGPLTLAWSDN